MPVGRKLDHSCIEQSLEQNRAPLTAHPSLLPVYDVKLCCHNNYFFLFVFRMSLLDQLLILFALSRRSFAPISFCPSHLAFSSTVLVYHAAQLLPLFILFNYLYL